MAKVRRRPQQDRARFTVDAILDAVSRILRKGGPKAVTTNRVAKVAGVSIGTVYQYFANKQQIFDALHERAFAHTVDRVDQTLRSSAPRDLDELVVALFRSVVAARAEDPELQRLLITTVPRSEERLKDARRMTEAFKVSVLEYRGELADTCDVDVFVFVLANMMGGLTNAVVLFRPDDLGIDSATDAAIVALRAYVDTQRAALPASSRR